MEINKKRDHKNWKRNKMRKKQATLTELQRDRKRKHDEREK